MMYQNKNLKVSLGKASFVWISLGLAALAPKTHAADPKSYAVEASATVQSSPAQIALKWAVDPVATGYTVSRKLKSATSWTTVGTLPGSATSFSDTSVSAGATYEYQLAKTTSIGYRGYGYVFAGIEAPLVESRGKVVLLVDSTHATALATELKRLESDLTGDGWVVLRHDVSRTASAQSIKAIIKADYSADPANVKSVFLFGHVPVPYSGDMNPDGHPDHRGAWPADTYYGDMDGNWTDNSVNNGGASRSANKNVPGDGKFDQTEIPSDIELAVGRVDLSNLTCFSNKSPSRSELDLLRQYLNKDHNWRHRLLIAERRGLICDNFGEKGGESFAASGWRNFAPFFGAENVKSVPYGSFFSNLSSQSYVWAYGTGGGSYYTCDGIGSADDFALNDTKAVFTMFLGSYFGDWDNESNFMRAALGGSSYTLTTSWAGRPHWYYHHMALGEPIGYSTLLSQNNRSGGLYSAQNSGTRQVHVTLLGDPTLRLHPVVPPAGLSGSKTAQGVSLSWKASTDTDLAGYHVYRAPSAAGPFARVSGNSPLTSTSFTDAGVTGEATYMVRAVKRETSGSGTYFNPSQGVFYSTTGGTPVPNPNPDPTPAPTAPTMPTGLMASAQGNAVTLIWADLATNETAYKVERKTGATGVYAQVASLGANITTFKDSALAAGTTYFYRVKASNVTGDSAYTTEVKASTAAIPATSASAAFVSTDSITQGNWKGVYGNEGFNIFGETSALPGYAQMSASGNTSWLWAWSTTEARALLKGASTDRVAGAWYSSSSQTIDLNLADGQAHRLALYCLDWDNSGRAQTVEISDIASGTVLDSRNVSGFSAGQYLVWDLKGNVRLKVTRTGGSNAAISGLFLGTASAPASPVATPGVLPNGGTFTNSVSVSLSATTPGATLRYTLDGSTPTATSALYSAPFTLSSSATVKVLAQKSGLTDSAVASASFTRATATPNPVPGNTNANQAAFVKKDSMTRGNWKNVYGSEGFNVIGNAAQYPAYAQVNLSGGQAYTWNPSTSDARALVKTGTATDRLASCWYTADSMTVTVKLTDGKAHRLALYCLDWDTTARAQTIEVLDGATGQVINSQTVSAFNGGQYLVWDVKGTVLLRFTRSNGNNAVLMGLFFGPAANGAAISTTGLDQDLGQFQLQVAGAVGQTFAIQASSDLSTWTQLNTVTLTEPTYNYVDNTSTPATSRFYRAVLIP